MNLSGTTWDRLTRPCVLAAVAVTLLPLLYFFPATSGSLIISPDDGVIQNIPFRVAVAEMVRNGYAPLWNPWLFCGMPLFAAAQAGVLFPLNWFYLLFPAALATNFMMLSTYMVAALGAYLYARRSGIGIAGAAVTSIIWQCGGFLVNQVGHTNIAHTAALLPWLLWAIDGYAVNGNRRRGLLLAAIVALQCFAGHQQTFAYAMMVAGAYCVVMWRAKGRADSSKFYLSSFLFFAAGLCLAALQIVPTLELLGQSLRSDASYGFFTSFSMPRRFVAAFFAPYLMGGGDGTLFRAPYVGPSFYAEYVGYVGLAGLLLTVLAIVFQRDAQTKFWACVVVVGLLLALGRYAPLGFNKLVYLVPGLNLFRVPARHLMEVQFAFAVLAGRGLAALLTHQDRRAVRRWILFSGAALLIVTWVVVAAGRPAAFRLGRTAPVTIMRAPELFLPLILAAISVWAIWLVARRGTRTSLAILIAILLLDLGLWGQFSGWRVSSPNAHAELWSEPAAFSFLRRKTAGAGAAKERYRILTQDHFFVPSEPASYAARVAEWSLPLQPDIAMMHALENAAGYEGFGLARYSRLAGDMKVWGDLTDPERTLRSESRELDLLNVRYLLVRADRATGRKTKGPALAEIQDAEIIAGEKFARGNLNLPVLATGETLSFSIPGTEINRVALLTTLAWGETAPDNAVVAQLRLHGSSGETFEFDLRAGEHTAEWAYDRPDVHDRTKHKRAPVATSYAVQEGEVKFDGHDYAAVFSLPKTIRLVGGEILVPAVVDAPRLLLTVNRVSLIGSNAAFSLPRERVSKQTAKDSAPELKQDSPPRWTAAGNVEGVSIFENQRVLPRTWLTTTERVTSAAEQIEIIRSGKMPDGAIWNPLECALVETPNKIEPASQKSGTAEIVRYEPNRVEVKSDAALPSLLILADNYYPGWRAQVDGQRAKVLRVNYNQRAVRLPGGSHVVTFVYRPKSVLYGLIVSIATLLALIWWARRQQPIRP
jgi:hypothetical protein